jgi:hapalindole H/12-epi-hapalindole U/12-epi-fischerindole U synthase
MNTCLRPLLLALGFGSALSASAVSITVLNPGFEDNIITDGAFVVFSDGPANWSRYDPSNLIDNNGNAVGVIRPNITNPYFPAGTTEGANAALVFLGGGVNGEAGLQQTLSATLQANTRYTLTVDIGNIASGTSLAGSSGGAGVFFDLDGFPGYRLDLLAGGVVIGSDNNSLGASIPEGQFRTASFNVDIGAAHAQLGQTLGIRLVNLDQAGTTEIPNIEVDFDNVRLDATAVPEPATAALFVSGIALGVAFSRRRRSV